LNSALINPSYYESDKLIYVLYLIYWEDKSRKDNYYIYKKKKLTLYLRRHALYSPSVVVDTSRKLDDAMIMQELYLVL